jgi:hypothetical protein
VKKTRQPDISREIRELCRICSPIDRPHWARFVAEKIKQLQSMARQKVKTDAAWIRRERKGEEIAILIITVMMYYRDDPATFIEMVAQALRGKLRDKYYDELLKKAFFQTMRKVSGRNDRFAPFNSEIFDTVLAIAAGRGYRPIKRSALRRIRKLGFLSTLTLILSKIE